MHLDFQCIEERFRLGPARLARRWKAASQCGMTHNAGIFHWKNHWIAPATHSASHNPYTEIHKVASAYFNRPSHYGQSSRIRGAGFPCNGLLSVISSINNRKIGELIFRWHCICSVFWYCEDNDHHTLVVAGHCVVPIHWPNGLQITAVFDGSGNAGGDHPYS